MRLIIPAPREGTVYKISKFKKKTYLFPATLCVSLFPSSPETVVMNSRAQSINLLRSARIFQEINSANLCSLAGRYDNPYSYSVPSPIDCLKILVLISNGQRIKPAFAKRDEKQTTTDLRGISTNWFKNRLCPSTRLSRLGAPLSCNLFSLSDSAVRCDITHPVLYILPPAPLRDESSNGGKGRQVVS